MYAALNSKGKVPTAMAEQKESSVLFSLKELMGLEEDRIREEESKKEAEARAAHDARIAAERAARDAEEARIRAADAERQRDEQRRKEEAARLEAIRHAEIERLINPPIDVGEIDSKPIECHGAVHGGANIQ